MYHQHLERQIKKHLGENYQIDDRMSALLKAVSNSYGNFERDKELSDHAFSLSEIEYQNLNQKLKDFTLQLEDKIKLRTRELEDIAQFPLENPNPIFRVNEEGKILFLNPAAAKIRKVEFEAKKYTIDNFFKDQVRYIKTSGTIELLSNDIQYIFYYVRVAEKKYVNFYGADVTEKNNLRIKAQENYIRFKSFLESTEDAYYILYAQHKDKNFINAKMNYFFGDDLEQSNDVLKEKSKHIISEKPAAIYNKIKKLALGEKLTLQYQIRRPGQNKSFWLNEVISKQYDVLLDDIVVSGRITNVTKEQEFALKIQESEERFRSLIEAVPVMVWVSDENNKVIYSNQASKNLLGFDVEKSKSPREFVARIHPEDRKRVMETWNKNTAKRKKFTSEYRIKDASDNYNYILENGVPRFFANGKFAGYIGAFYNLTAEKKSQIELKVENEKLDLLTKNSPDIIFLTNQKGIIEYVSPTAQRILGYKSSELIKKDIRKFICLECKNHLENISWFNNFEANKTRKFEYRMVKRNGDLLWVESLMSNIKNGDDDKIIMHNRDINSIKAAEIILKENEQKYRGLFENMELGVMEVDLNEKIKWVNQSFEKLTGYSLKYLKGKNALKLFLPDEKTRKTMEAIGQTRKNRGDNLYEIKMKKKQGDLLDVVISGSPIIDLQGNVKGSVGIHWNVTEIRKIEKMLEEEKLNRQKEIMQATLNAEEQQREILGNELHDGVGHILTYTSLYLQMASQSDTFTPEQFKKAHEKVELALNEVRRISRSLVPPALIDLGLKEAIIELFNQYSGMNGFSFNLDCKKQDLEKIDDDVQRNIYRIIQELINNTIKHAQAKKVALQIKRNKENLLIQYHNDGNSFNPSKVKKGVGLQSITNRTYFYSGVFNINSTKAKGTQFSIELPLKNIITHE